MAVYRTALCFTASVQILGVCAKKAECAEQPLWHKHVQGLAQQQAHSCPAYRRARLAAWVGTPSACRGK